MSGYTLGLTQGEERGKFAKFAIIDGLATSRAYVSNVMYNGG